MDADELLQKALALSQQAIDHDKAKNYKAALDAYIRALDQWALVCKYQRNPNLQEKFMAKMKEYVDRAEYLKGLEKQPIQASDPKTSETLDSNMEGIISTTKPNVKWSDIAGLEAAKDALQEAVILPIRFPSVFTDKLKPWHGILLYGPPGTGKSFLAKACATECDATYISISSSDVMSKWQGESEKFIKSLFTLAKARAPCVVFIDEIDSLCTSRSDNDSDTSRRVKTEFLVQMQVIDACDSGERVLILAATNLPWALDSAIIRRFEKRIYIPLPDVRARRLLIGNALQGAQHDLTPEDMDALAKHTEGYSGSDLSILVRDVLMQSIRKCKNATHFKKVKVNGKEMYTPCSPGDPCKSKIGCNLMSIAPDQLHLPIVTMQDCLNTLETSRSSVIKSDLDAYVEWTKNYGQEGC